MKTSSVEERTDRESHPLPHGTGWEPNRTTESHRPDSAPDSISGILSGSLCSARRTTEYPRIGWILCGLVLRRDCGGFCPGPSANSRRYGSILLVTARYFGPIITVIRCVRPIAHVPQPSRAPVGGQKQVRSRDRGSPQTVPLWSVPAIAWSRQTAVESYRSPSVSTVETSTPAIFRDIAAQAPGRHPVRPDEEGGPTALRRRGIGATDPDVVGRGRGGHGRGHRYAGVSVAGRRVERSQFRPYARPYLGQPLRSHVAGVERARTLYIIGRFQRLTRRF